jgi:hypothetical protein
MHDRPIQQKQSESTSNDHSSPESEGKGQSLNPPAFQLMASDGGADAPPVQRKESSGGLPGDLVSGFAASTGHDLSNVNVHRNSDKPSQVGALAYAQGNDIHLGAGQDQHLAHEAAHIVQQREGRVQANTSVGGMPVNNSASLESEADSMGSKAAQMKAAPQQTIQRQATAGSGAIQREVDYNALATTLKAELDEYFPDTEDVIAIFEQIPWTDGLSKLGSAYNLVSPGKPMMMALKEELSVDAYRQVMERATGVAVETAGGSMNANVAVSGYNLRADGNSRGTQIGKLDYKDYKVTVSGKSVSGDEVFYKIGFTKADFAKVTAGYDVAKLAPGLATASEAWVTGDALGMYLSWDAMIAQLEHFDVFTFDKSIEEKITMLRQMSHSSNLPFNEIIGTSGPGYYEDKRPDVYNFYQIMKEGKAVKTPNGEIIDIYHFLVGLEAYQTKNRKSKASVSKYGVTMNSDVGMSDAASTWAGDLGSAAADAYLSQSKGYEDNLKAKGGAKGDEREDYYFNSRAPKSDLLADIDAWGAYEDVENGTAVTITELVRNYYGVQKLGAASFKPKRKKALDNFFARYGITPTGGKYDTPANMKVVGDQIDKFSTVWVQYRTESIWPTYDPKILRTYSDYMATKFLWLIEDLVANYH